MLPSVQIYSVYYNHFPLLPKASYITPIQAGACNSGAQLNMIGDDTGDNISTKNHLYSELTALYWIVKNADRHSDALGFCHYRRYLISDQYKLFVKKRSRYYTAASEKNRDSLLTPTLYTSIQELLSENDIIVPRPDYSMKHKGIAYTVEQAYELAHIKADWDVTMKVIREKYPEYGESIELLSCQTKMVFNNIMIAPWRIWDNYSTFLFEILFEVEKQIELPKQGYQTRVMGFLAERLLNLFIIHNKLKAAHLTMGLFKEKI